MHKHYEGLSGLLYGRQKIWMEPGDAVVESPMVAVIENDQYEQSISINYTWKYLKETIKGSFLIDLKKGENYTCIWKDTWHNKNTSMLLEGELYGSKIFTFLGSYGTKDNAIWGWKIKIIQGNKGIVSIFMYNIDPNGQECLAVDIFLYQVKPDSYNQKLQKLTKE